MAGYQALFCNPGLADCLHGYGCLTFDSWSYSGIEIQGSFLGIEISVCPYVP